MKLSAPRLAILACWAAGCAPRGGADYRDQVESAEATYGREVVALHRYLLDGTEVGSLNSDMRMAVRMAEDETRKRLARPLTMSGRKADDAFVIEFKNEIFFVRSVVTAENAFGVREEVPYEALLEKSSGGWSSVGP